VESLSFTGSSGLGDVPLTGAIDRVAELRTIPGVVADALRDPATRVVMVHRRRLAVRGDALDLVDAAALAGLAEAEDEQATARWLLLGRGDAASGGLRLALVVPDAVEPISAERAVATSAVASDSWEDALRDRDWATLREVADRLDAQEAALAAPTVALVAWHANHQRCPRCGEPTVVTHAGWVRRCVAEGVDHFPRTDPAVIMAVVDEDDRLLLGHASAWAPGRFSTLAGYVEPGESLEQAVRREVHEEVGVTIGDVAYRASQPWPFPASLMLGFRAQALSTEVTVDDDEIDAARWFTRDELARAARAGEVLLPGRSSISRALVEEWYGGPVG
jgi:NAD+ diphosphatase